LQRGAWVYAIVLWIQHAPIGGNGGVHPEFMRWIEAASVGRAIPDLTLSTWILIRIEDYCGRIVDGKQIEAPDRFEAEALVSPCLTSRLS